MCSSLQLTRRCSCCLRRDRDSFQKIQYQSPRTGMPGTIHTGAGRRCAVDVIRPFPSSSNPALYPGPNVYWTDLYKHRERGEAVCLLWLGRDCASDARCREPRGCRATYAKRGSSLDGSA